MSAKDTAEQNGLSVRSTNTIYQCICVRIEQDCATQSPFECKLESDDYFASKRIRGKRGRGAGSKTINFGLLKRGNCVYTEILPNAYNPTQ